jgi:hypothetical protein
MQAHGRCCDTCRCPHAIAPECPLDCLSPVLSRAILNTLARAYDAPFDPPETVGEVVELYQRGQLGDIWGLGPRRIGEIEVGLIVAGVTTALTAGSGP